MANLVTQTGPPTTPSDWKKIWQTHPDIVSQVTVGNTPEWIDSNGFYAFKSGSSHLNGIDWGVRYTVTVSPSTTYVFKYTTWDATNEDAVYDSGSNLFGYRKRVTPFINYSQGSGW